MDDPRQIQLFEEDAREISLPEERLYLGTSRREARRVRQALRYRGDRLDLLGDAQTLHSGAVA
jgi:hypothetical protein